MAKALRVIGTIAASVALIATGVGAAAGAKGLTIAGTLITAKTAATVATVAGITAGVANAGAQLLAPKPIARGSPAQVVIDLEPPRPYIVGRVMTGGVLRYDAAYGPTIKKVPNPWRWQVRVLSGVGPIQGIVGEFFDFEPIGGFYTGFYATTQYLGARPQIAALVPPYGPAPGWDASSRISGCAHVGVNFLFDRDGERFAQGLPICTWLCDGELVYDPRQDSTFPGGSGPCRLGQESTYVYSRSPALHFGTYGYGRFEDGQRIFGLGLSADAIDWPAIVDWANDCDANGWTANVILTEGGIGANLREQRVRNLDDLAAAGGARWFQAGGLLSVDWHRPRVPLATLTDDDILEAGGGTDAVQTVRDRMNGVRPQYISPDHNWQQITAAEIIGTTYRTEDDEPLTQVWPLNAVTDPVQAGQLAAYAMADSRELGPMDVQAKAKWRFYRPGDCLQIDSSLIAYQGQAVINTRSLNPQTLAVGLSLKSETPGKHPFALGKVATPPPTPVLAQTPEERDLLAAALRRPRAAEVEFDGGETAEDLKPAEFGSNRTQTANANRVPFSRMEGGFGWQVFGGTMASFTPIIPFEFQGRPFIQCDATASAAGQTGLIGSAPFAVIGGERLSISSRIDAFAISGPAPQSWALFIEYRQGNTFLSSDLIASGTGAAPSALTLRQEDFSTVPPNANNAYLVLSVTAAGASLIRMAFLEPMVTSAIEGQAIHPPFSPGPNAFDAADVTSQNTAAFINGQTAWATWPGLTPSVLEAELAAARADATASLADLTAIASDAVLDRGEKPAVRERRANIMAEFPIWRDRAVDFGVAVGLRNSYTTSYNELIAYLTAINLDANTNSPIVRADFIAAFVNYATQRELVIEAISQIAAQRALWAGVTGTGRPEDNADVTAGKTAAFINGQTAWATWTGLTPAVLEAELATARADATASLADLTAIASDGVVTRGEKISVRERRTNIMAEFPIWRDRAVDFGVDTAIRSNYQAAYDALIAYLTAINIDANTNSNVVRADFVAGFNNYAIWRERVIEAISQIAAQRALWAGVTGTGRPEDNADVTAGKTAAFIAGQSPWATTAIPVGKLAQPRANVFPYPFGPTDGRTPAQIGWANTSGGGGSLISVASIPLDGVVYQYARISGGSSFSAFPSFAMAYGAGLQTSVSLSGFGNGASLLPSVDCLNAAQNTILANHPLIYNAQTDRWEANGFTTPAGTAFLRVVPACIFPASGSFQEVVFWAIKVERGPNATPFMDSSLPRMFGNQIEYDNGFDLNTLRPAEFGSDKTTNQPVVGLLNPVTGRATSRRITSQIVATGVLQTLNTNPITASTDGGTGVSTITINAHTVFDDFGQIDFSGASIGGLSSNTLYYVYETNPDFVGGARSYVATTNRDALTTAGRRYVGFVTTPAAGSGPNNGSGGGGAGFPGLNPELAP